jgi:hypothetical protein
MSRFGVMKRVAMAPPVAIRRRLPPLSKADLLEVAWALAALSNNAGSVDDDESTLDRLIEEVNTWRAMRGQGPLRAIAREEVRL